MILLVESFLGFPSILLILVSTISQEHREGISSNLAQQSFLNFYTDLSVLPVFLSLLFLLLLLMF